MNILIIIIQLIFCAFTTQAQEPAISEAWPFEYGDSFNASTACPAPNEINKSIVEDFLTKSYWASERAETNTGSITVSQITLLTDSSHSNVCTSLNNTYQEALDEENGLGEPAYNVTYYNAGSFYFVVISIRQSDDPNYITSGVNYITVHNQSLDLIKGYAF